MSAANSADNPAGPSLALLSNGASPHNDNHARILAALERDGWTVTVFGHSDICQMGGELRALDTPLGNFDLVWMLGLGEQHDFIDRCQLLANLPPKRMVNSALGMLALHSKHVVLPHSPLSCSGNRPEQLLRFAGEHPDIDSWVVKPAAGSYGRGVVKAGDAAQLEQALSRATTGHQYCVLQAYVREIEAGETRCLVMNGDIVGSYLRIPDRDFLANLSQGARARETVLDTHKIAQVQDIANVLASHGIRFAAIDMAFPYLIEVNIANPGGLATLASLSSEVPGPTETRLAKALRGLL